MKTRDQLIAETVYIQVREYQRQSNDAELKQYGAMAHKLPVLIRTAGLAQALAFVAASAKKKEPYQKLLEHLAHAVSEKSAEQFIAQSREAELGEYAKLTQHSLAALLWYKRFSQSVLGVEAGDEILLDGIFGFR